MKGYQLPIDVFFHKTDMECIKFHKMGVKRTKLNKTDVKRTKLNKTDVKRTKLNNIKSPTVTVHEVDANTTELNSDTSEFITFTVVKIISENRGGGSLWARVHAKSSDWGIPIVRETFTANFHNISEYILERATNECVSEPEDTQKSILNCKFVIRRCDLTLKKRDVFLPDSHTLKLMRAFPLSTLSTTLFFSIGKLASKVPLEDWTVDPYGTVANLVPHGVIKTLNRGKSRNDTWSLLRSMSRSKGVSDVDISKHDTIISAWILMNTTGSCTFTVATLQRTARTFLKTNNITEDHIKIGLVQSPDMSTYTLQRVLDVGRSIVYNLESLIQYLPPEQMAPPIDSIPSRLTVLQGQVFMNLKKHAISILHGSAGVGKTSTAAAAIVELTQHPNVYIDVVAPTGAASHRMCVSVDDMATDLKKSVRTGKVTFRTIHSAVYTKDDGDDIDRGIHSAVYTKDDGDDIDRGTQKWRILIVDEMSMVSLNLMSMLLRNVCEDMKYSRYLFIGDPQQLPSIEHGCVFRDMIDSDIFPVVHLQEVHRQRGGTIIKNSQVLFRKDEVFDQTGGDFYVEVYRSSDDKFLQRCIHIVLKYKKLDMTLAVICQTRKWRDLLNIELQNIYNPNGIQIDYGRSNGYIYRIGDKIIFLKNEKGCYFNGEPGTVKSGDKENLYIVKEDKCTCVLRVKIEYLNTHIAPAWARTVYKAQGDEFDNVLIVLDNCPEYQSRAALFTAITRAKSFVYTLARSDSILKAAMQNEFHRQTNLLHLLKHVPLGI